MLYKIVIVTKYKIFLKPIELSKLYDDKIIQSLLKTCYFWDCLYIEHKNPLNHMLDLECFRRCKAREHDSVSLNLKKSTSL